MEKGKQKLARLRRQEAGTVTDKKEAKKLNKTNLKSISGETTTLK